jgi:3-hydroxyisobutyrate dehydrogenase-like beta-hydroxyacid dehydrogenase
MQIQTVGILSPGDMGQAIASVLSQNGLKTIAALDDRSDVYDGLRLRTRQLAAAANILDVGSVKQLVIESDVVLSVLVPAAATKAAEQVAEVIGSVGKSILYVDANAISPHKVRSIAQIIESKGGEFIDASIIGPPPLIYRLVKETSLGRETPEVSVRDRLLPDIITALSQESLKSQ